MLERDLRLMAELGANTLRTFTVPPRWLLDRAAEHGLRVLVTIPWAEHVCFLDRKDLVAEIRGTMRAAAANLGEHPALLGLLDRQRDPARHRALVRARAGARASSRSLRDEIKQRRAGHAGQLRQLPVDRVPRPAEFLDFVSFNVYLHREADFRRYLCRLQNLAEDKPLVLTEFGIDSIREGEEHQAELLVVAGARRLRVGRRRDASSSPGPTTGSPAAHQIDDWAFGLVDARARARSRRSTPCRRRTPRRCRRALARTPRVSVVICAYNAERTMDAVPRVAARRCATRTTRSSSSTTARPIARWRSSQSTSAVRRRPGGPHFVLIDQENKGLSVARNVGAEAATRRDRRLHRLRLRRRSRLADVPRLQVRAQRLRRGRRPELPAARAEPGAGGGRGVARRPDARAARTTRSPSTSRAATWPSPRQALRRGRRLRADLRGRRRRRRLLLAPAEPRLRRSASAPRPWSGTTGATR